MTTDQREMRVLKIREHPDPIGLDTTGEDVNELTISGHIEHDLELTEDDYGQWVCRFVLTHTTTHYETGHWELQYYDVTLYGAKPFARHYQPGQMILITGQLDHHVQTTPTGSQSQASIHAHTIITAHGPQPQPTAKRSLTRGRRRRRNR
jgi:single-stranded DNA-binding protein